MTCLRPLVVWLTCLGAIGLAFGCHPTADPTSPRSPTMMPGGASDADAESGPFAAGKKVFADQNCARCHSGGGAGGTPMGGPPGAGGPPGRGGPMAGGPPPDGPPPGAGGPPPGRGGGGRGPDLAHVGRDPNHTVEWLMGYVRNPRATKPDSRMPSFESKISEDDLRALAEYLASLK
jgi:mono/diheme cytochrome c family protein